MIHQLNTSGTITATYPDAAAAATTLGIKQPVLEYHIKHGTPAKIKGFRFQEVADVEPESQAALLSGPQPTIPIPAKEQEQQAQQLIVSSPPQVSAIVPEPASEADTIAPQIQVYPPLSRTEQLAEITKQKRRAEKL